MPSTLVIADLGASHDGDLTRAKGLIDRVATGGGNAVKLQFWSDSTRLAQFLGVPELVSVYEAVRLPTAWLRPLGRYAHARGLEFLCTVDLPEDVPAIAELVDRFKVPSNRVRDQAFIAALAQFGKPLVISTGMMDAFELPPLVEAWGRQPFWTWLHCVSGYPTPLGEANLGVLHTLRAAVAGRVGFSDHTGHVWTGAFAVCAGATVLEVHVRADDTPRENPDFPHALPPLAFRSYIRHVRLAETMLGDGRKRIMPSERPSLAVRRPPP